MCGLRVPYLEDVWFEGTLLKIARSHYKTLPAPYVFSATYTKKKKKKPWIWEQTKVEDIRKADNR